MRSYTLEQVFALYRRRDLDPSFLGTDDAPTGEAQLLIKYLNYRADFLQELVRPLLMNREEAQAEFDALYSRFPQAECHLPMNKQKGEKAHNAFLTGMVNLLTEATLGGVHFADNPAAPITITQGRRPTRTLSRWMDGAYPGLNNPAACWEIKEYYGTTTFGSRVADGIYETIMDGLEIAELREHVRHNLRHYLIVDDRFTWWEMGRSYLCRIVDMLHMGLVDEVLFGREVLTRWPEIVTSWPREE
jgi:hypothetical protein